MFSTSYGPRASSGGSQPPPPRSHPNPSSRIDESASMSSTLGGEPSLCHYQRCQDDSKGDGTFDLSMRSDQGDNQGSVSPVGLTEESVHAVFGNSTTLASFPSKAFTSVRARGVGGAPRVGRRLGGIIMPTRKEGSDSVSMYSMSQSVLPMDPRERIYYRPRRHLLQCYLERRPLKELGITSLLPGSHKSFQFFLEHTNEFVLAAVPRNFRSHAMVEDTSNGVGGQFYSVAKGGSNIVFTINAHQLDGDARSFVGRLSRRGDGMEMVMFSEGSKSTRKEILAVLLNNFADKSVSSLTVVLPAIDPESGYIKPLEGGEVRFLRDGRGGTSIDGGSRAGIDEALEESFFDDVGEACSIMSKAAPIFPAVGDSLDVSGAPGATGSSETAGGHKKSHVHSLLAREYESNPNSPNIIVLKSKAPQWDGVLRGYKLDFHQRATKASEKNFQLVAACDPGKVVMLFGKQSDDRFALDFRYPLCGLQAAAIATSIMTARKVMV